MEGLKETKNRLLHKESKRPLYYRNVPQIEARFGLLSSTYINWLANTICSIDSRLGTSRFSCVVGLRYAAKAPSNYFLSSAWL